MIPATALLLGLLPAVIDGSGALSRGELSLSLEGGYFADARGASASAILGGSLSAIFFLDHKVKDDATPLPLQPFLQRAATLRLGLRGALYPDGGLGRIIGNEDLGAS